MLLMKKDEEVGNVKDKGSLGCRKHDILQFNILKEVSKGNAGITTLDFRIYFSLFRNVLCGIPQKTALQGRVAQDRWSVLVDPLFNAQEQEFLTVVKQARQKASMNRELLSELKREKGSMKYEEGGSSTRVPRRNTQTWPKNAGMESGKTNLRRSWK